VDFVREFQDALGIERSNIVGHSMGGWVASLFAYESPDRVNKLVLVASGGAATRTLASMTQFKPPSKEQIRHQMEQRVKAPGVDLDQRAEIELAKTQLPGAVDAYQRVLNHMNNATTRARYNTLRRLPHIKAPTLVVWGTDDATNALELGKQTHELLPSSKMVIIENCGHYIPTEHPDELNRALIEFL
jgi:pimeloyl-ACP methyl ester carboxylesterase